MLESADARAASDTLEAVARNHSLTHDVAGYYPLLKLGMRPQDLAPSFVSNSSSSTLIEVECSTYMTDQPTIDYLHWLEERVDELQAAHGSSLEVDLLGAPLIIEEAADTAMSDLEHMDAIVLPLSFAILAGVIGSFRLLLVPLLTIGVAAAGAFGITALIARATPIFTITPSLMMSILIAMSIDYALFLLTRFRQERLQGRSVPAAVEVLDSWEVRAARAGTRSVSDPKRRGRRLTPTARPLRPQAHRRYGTFTILCNFCTAVHVYRFTPKAAHVYPTPNLCRSRSLRSTSGLGGLKRARSQLVHTSCWVAQR